MYDVAMGLAHALVTAPDGGGETPQRWMLFLHGILGSGANWRTFAKKILSAASGWGAVLVDLRLHGESQTGFATPHTLAACANDLEALVRELESSWATSTADVEQAPRVQAMLAHSFGGKVALEYAARDSSSLEHLFVIDSTPSARPDAKGSESTRHIVELLTNLPTEFPDRTSFTAWMEERGVSRPIAMWLAMNVRPIPRTTRFAFRVDVQGIRELLADYFAKDLWNVLEHPTRATRFHLIAGGRSQVVDASDRQRAQQCPTTTLDVIEDADHWVHVDAPDALREIVLRYL